MKNKKVNHLEIVPENVNNILILLHGYGSDSEDMLSLGLSFRSILPNTAIISIDAPNKCESGFGYQWFSMQKMNLFTVLKEIKTSYHLLNDFIDEQLHRFSLTDRDLLLGGFSQGAIMSLYTGFRRKTNPMGILSFSGMLPDTVETLKRDMTSKPEILLIHGSEDRTVPFDHLNRIEKILRVFDVSCECCTVEGMGHEINANALKYATNFIKRICNKTDI